MTTVPGLPGSISPFEIHVPQAELEELTRRLAVARWPDIPATSGWESGVEATFLRRLAAYWLDGYDWRQHEAELNRLAQFTTVIDAQLIHFVHVRSSQPDATPLLLLHCWPSTFADFAGMVGPLTEPATHGRPDDPAFHVVIPSLPGFGFSGPTREPGWGVERMGAALAALMKRLRYRDYLVQGGGWASLIAPAVGTHADGDVRGIHVNAMINGSNVSAAHPQLVAGLDDRERASVDDVDAHWQQRRGYADLMATRPQTASYALHDSPVGLLAWIADLEWAVDGRSLSGETTVDHDTLLTIASIFWFTRTMNASARLYKAHGDWLAPFPYNPIPTAVAVFPGDRTLRVLAERQHDVRRYTELDRGGWFPALQAPDLLVDDLRAFARELVAESSPGRP